ncbi:glycosyltransferase [Fibrella sp. USSR17]
MATFNGGNFIKEQVSSILEQLTCDDELIISDDSSTDDTLNIINQFNDSRIKVYPNMKFKNAVLNFEYALSKSSGAFIFLADQDDVWLEGRVEKMMEELKKFDLVVSNCKFIDKNNRLMINVESFFDIYKSGKGFFKNLTKNTYIGNCMAFNRQLLNYSLPFPKSISNYPNIDHGYWIGLVADSRFKVKFISEVFLHYRRHDNNVSPTGPSAKSPFPLSLKIKARLSLLSALSYHIIKKLIS